MLDVLERVDVCFGMEYSRSGCSGVLVDVLERNVLERNVLEGNILEGGKLGTWDGGYSGVRMGGAVFLGILRGHLQWWR